MSIATGSRSTGCAPCLPANVSIEPLGGLSRVGVDGLEVGHDGFDRAAGDERHEIEPVRADVGDGAQFAAFRPQHTPVEVGRVQQPVLDVAAMDVQHRRRRCRS